MAKHTTTFSMRMPEDLNEKIQAYATEHNCTKAEAMSHFARAGIELEEGGAPLPERPQEALGAEDASAASQEMFNKIQERLDALQNLPRVESVTTTAIVPADIRDKIQEYSERHDCSENEALTYYARLGVQMSDEQRPASANEVAELARRLDVIVQDNQSKTEQLRQMSELITTIHANTKPDEIELEGELAEQDAEDVEETELSDEERQRIADEHTRKIVSDVMGDYMTRQRKEQEAREAQRAAQQPQRQNTTSVWIPVLVAVIVSLIMGLVVVLTR
jgi:hypothetical protein